MTRKAHKKKKQKRAPKTPTKNKPAKRQLNLRCQAEAEPQHWLTPSYSFLETKNSSLGWSPENRRKKRKVK